jgi:hypothetical protein
MRHEKGQYDYTGAKEYQGCKFDNEKPVHKSVFQKTDLVKRVCIIAVELYVKGIIISEAEKKGT